MSVVRFPGPRVAPVAIGRAALRGVRRGGGDFRAGAAGARLVLAGLCGGERVGAVGELRRGRPGAVGRGVAGGGGMSVVIKGLEKVARDRRAVIAAQVRTSTGYTAGRVVDGGAVVPLLRQAGAPRRQALSAAKFSPFLKSADLLALLRGWPEGVPLPRTAELGALLRIDPAVDGGVGKKLSAAFTSLFEAGATRTLTQQGRGGERAVWLVAERRVLMTEGAPLHWEAVLRRASGHG
jgi:hypothetical protein